MNHFDALEWYDRAPPASRLAAKARMYLDLQTRAGELASADEEVRIMLTSAAFTRAVAAETARGV